MAHNLMKQLCNIRRSLSISRTIYIISYQRSLIKNRSIIPAHNFLNNAIKSKNISNVTESNKSQEFQQFLEHLKNDSISFKRVNYNTLIGAINCANEQQFSHNEGILLLNCCSMLPDKKPEDRLAVIDEIWPLIVKSGAPTKEHIIALIKSYSNTGKNIDNFKGFLDMYKCSPDINVYEELLYLACENGHVSDGIVRILSYIKEINLPITENIFNALIMGHSRSKNIENCEKVLHTMAEAELEPTARTYKELIRAYIENGNLEKAEQILSEKGQILGEEELYTIIKSAELHDASRLVPVALKFLPETALYSKNIASGLKNICIEFVRIGRTQSAYNLLNGLPMPKFNPNEDVDKYAAFLLNEIVRKDVNSSEVIHICKQLVESGRNPRALHVCCEIALRINSTDSLIYMQEIVKTESLRPQYFWPIFLSFYGTSGETGILMVLKEMQNLHVTPDKETIEHYILPKLARTLKDTKNCIQILDDRGLKMPQLMVPLLSHLLQQNRLDEALQIAQTYKTKINGEETILPLVSVTRKAKSTNVYKSIAQLIQAIFAKSLHTSFDLAGQFLLELASSTTNKLDYPSFMKLIEELHAIGIKLSGISTDVLLQHISRSTDSELKSKADKLLRKMVDRKLSMSSSEQFSTYISHPRDMSLQELECHLVELQSKNLNARGVLRRILQLSVREGQLDRALEVNKLCQEQKVSFSPGMLASILDLMIRTKDINGCETALANIKKTFPAFLIDDHKIIDFATLLMENDRLDDVKILLKNNAGPHVRGGVNIHKNLWQLLSSTATISAINKSKENITKELLDYLVNLKYCEYHNTLLGPIIRDHLLKSEIKQAIDEFLRIAETYKKTPLQYELISKLIELSNSSDTSQYNLTNSEIKEYLQQVIKTSTKIRGAASTHVLFIVAMAQSGTEKQLRKVLMDPNIQVNAEGLIKQCEYLIGMGAVPAILKLAKCSRGVEKSVKAQELYNLLLNSFIRDNDPNSALGLFEKIIADDEQKLSQDFNRSLVSLLEKNNLEIPSNLKLYANIV